MLRALPSLRSGRALRSKSSPPIGGCGLSTAIPNAENAFLLQYSLASIIFATPETINYAKA